jgi:hypothetical protein
MKIIILLLVLVFTTSCNGQFKNNSKQQTNKMEINILTEFISTDSNAKTLLLFGGNVERRHEIISLLQPITSLSVHGALSEEEGIAMLQSLPSIDIVLIGGRYTEEQRIRIRKLVHTNYPAITITEPGVDYMYSNEAIFTTIKNILNEATQ